MSLLALLMFSPVVSAADDVVAKLGSIEMKASQVKDMLSKLDPDIQKQLNASPATVVQLIRAEMIKQLLLKEITTKQWDKKPEVQDQIARSREQIIVSSYLNDIARPDNSYPDENEVKQFYESNKDALNLPAQLRIAQIFIANESGQPSEVEKKAQELAAQAKLNNTDFAQLARKHSQHRPSAEQGGDIGWYAEAQLLPEMRSVLATMSVGQVSAAIKSNAGWHIVKLLEKRPAGVQPYDEAHASLVSTMRLNKAKQNEQQYLENIVKDKKFEVNEIAVGKLTQ